MLKSTLSKAKKSNLTKKNLKAQFSVDEYILKRDYTGALTLLEFKYKSKDGDLPELLSWIGYCAFQLGNFQRAEKAYRELLDTYKVSDEFNLYLSCCYFYQHEYDDALDVAKKGPTCSLKTRLLFNIYHCKGDEKMVLLQHQQLKDTCEDQLTLAALHFQRGHYQEATDVYKRLLLENRDDLAYNVYVAMCYYKLDYYDVSLEILASYLQSYPTSQIAINLKACNHFRLYNGKAAESELKGLLNKTDISGGSSDLIRHNMVAFSNGDSALQVLPNLLDTILEARLNLVIYHLRRNNIQEAYALIKDIEPTSPQEFILKAVVCTTLGQKTNNKELIKSAQACFQAVGTSTHECDTIPGRQAMASFFFLVEQYDDVNVYLSSIKSYLYNDDDFNYNYGLSLAATRQYKLAEETLLQVKNEKYRSEFVYILWLTKCFIMNGNPKSAWEMHLKLDSDTSNSSGRGGNKSSDDESLQLLKVIANDCYKVSLCNCVYICMRMCMFMCIDTVICV